jgi:predicted transglutaminase-like cysteine proteinase
MAAAACLLLTQAAPALARSTQTASIPVTSLPVEPQGSARAPVGWTDFCNRNPADCAIIPGEPARINLDAQTWRKIDNINAQVNRDIIPVTDLDHWGVMESWDYPDDGKGDCEDYALQKRKLLIQAGFPRRALLMTVVLDEDQAGHAVLMVRTDRGDFILDNKTSAIKPWTQTGYVYVKRESQTDTAWVSLGGAGSATATAAR